jgi:predicted DNA-binding transcriptional regulator AlpA
MRSTTRKNREPQRKPTPQLLSRDAVLAMLGGDKPLHISTLYRWVESRRFPKPVKVGGSVRWIESECRAALQRMVDARDAEV